MNTDDKQAMTAPSEMLVRAATVLCETQPGNIADHYETPCPRCLERTRALLKAIREPTEEDLVSACARQEEVNTLDQMRAGYQAMIDQILAEKSPPRE